MMRYPQQLRSSNGQANKSVLILEDDVEIAEPACWLLERRGWVVHHAIGWQDTEPLLQTLDPNLILLDLNLCDSHGENLIEIFRRTWPDSQIVVMTGEHDAARLASLDMSRPDAVLFKPVKFPQLLEIIESRG